MYLEDITDGHAFIEVPGKSPGGGKPILALKAGARLKGQGSGFPHRFHGRVGCRL